MTNGEIRRAEDNRRHILSEKIRKCIFEESVSRIIVHDEIHTLYPDSEDNGNSGWARWDLEARSNPVAWADGIPVITPGHSREPYGVWRIRTEDIIDISPRDVCREYLEPQVYLKSGSRLYNLDNGAEGQVVVYLIHP